MSKLPFEPAMYKTSRSYWDR